MYKMYYCFFTDDYHRKIHGLFPTCFNYLRQCVWYVCGLNTDNYRSKCLHGSINNCIYNIKMQIALLKIIEKTTVINVHEVTVIMLILLNIFYTTGNNVKYSNLIYILEWTPTHAEPFNFLEQGQEGFQKRKCAFQNCFLTSNHTYFLNVLKFDVIIFNAVHMKNVTLPPKRSPYQKYVMVAMEPAGYYPLDAKFNDFFNFTWTYKLDSDVPFPYIIIKNQLGEVIGPKIDMHWMKVEQMNETSAYVIDKLRNKYIAAACFVSNCMSYKRLKFVYDLKNELSKFGERLDIYGKCGNYQCPVQSTIDECYALIESDYYFYLAFENSFGADYVSEKLLHALEHFAVPVVLGGANYSR